MHKYFTLLLVLMAGISGWYAVKLIEKYENKNEIAPRSFKGKYKIKDEAGNDRFITGAQGGFELNLQRRANQNTGLIHPEHVWKARFEAYNQEISKSCDDNEIKKPLIWEELGPINVGGRTRSLVIDKNNPNMLYCGSVAGGLWMSKDAGNNWKQIAIDANINSNTISAMTQAADGNIYIGTGEYRFDSGIAGDSKSYSALPGTGVFKYNPISGEITQLPQTVPNYAGAPEQYDWAFVTSISAHPTNANIVYASTNRGVYMTNDGGTTWFQPNGLKSKAAGWDVAVAANGRVWAAVGSTVMVSDANGENFSNYAGKNGLPSKDVRKKIAISPTHPNYVYIVLLGKDFGCISGIFETTNGGEHWNEITGEENALFSPCASHCQCWYDLAMTVDPFNHRRLFLGGVTLWTWAEDTGWNSAANGNSDPSNYYYIHSDIHNIIFDPTKKGRVYVIGDGGVFRSTDADNLYPTWKHVSKNFNVTQFYAMGAGFYGNILGGTQDNGTQYISYDYNSKKSATHVFGGDGFYSEISSIKPKVLFCESQYGNMERSSTDGDSWTSFFDDHIDADQDGNIDGGAPFSTAFFLWENLTRFYDLDGVIEAKFVTGGNNGIVWATDEPLKLSTIPYWYSLGKFKSGFLSDFSFVTNGKTGYAISSSGSLMRFKNIGADLKVEATEIAASSFNGRYGTGVYVDPGNPNNLAVTLGNYGNNDYVFLSNNAFGLSPSFTSIQHNLPKMPVYAVVMLPDNPEHYVIVGTELGVWSYNKNTECWTEFSNEMGRTPVFRLILKDMKTVGCKVLYAATHGRGMFRSTTITYPFCDTALPETLTDSNNLQTSQPTLKISPNPASTVAIIDLSLPTQALTSPTQATVRFYSIDGQLAKTETINDLLTEQHTVGINLAGLAAGMYLVEVATPAWRVAKPLLIQTAN